MVGEIDSFIGDKCCIIVKQVEVVKVEVKIKLNRIVA